MNRIQNQQLEKLRAIYKRSDLIKVKIIANRCYHGFDIGQIVYMHCRNWASDNPLFNASKHRRNGWYIIRNDYEIVSNNTQEDIDNLPSSYELL